MVAEVEAQARALRRAGHEQISGAGGEDGGGREVAGRGEGAEGRVARGGSEVAAAEGARHEVGGPDPVSAEEQGTSGGAAGAAWYRVN